VPYRVVLLTNILPPYRVPLFNALSRCEGFTFTVAFLAERESNRRWRVRADELTVTHVTLPGWGHYLWRVELPLQVNWSVYRFLKQQDPHAVIIGGYASVGSWLALLFCRLHGRRLILWSGTTHASVRLRSLWMRAARRLFVRAADAFVTYGTRASEFLVSLGAKRESVFAGPNVGDVDYFRDQVRRYREAADFAEARAARRGPVMLFVGQFIPRKGVVQFLRALTEVRQQEWTAYVVGEGPLRAHLESLRDELGLTGRVQFEPFQEREDLVRFYSLADIFVLPSLLEVGAIVVSEALASGLYVLASQSDGVAPDLIQPGRNGRIFDPANPEAFSSALNEALQIVSRTNLRHEIVASIASHTPDAYANAFCRALRYAFEASPRPHRKAADAIGADR
jgi:glycosyltransferase involved in cell wall biosynthesis